MTATLPRRFVQCGDELAQRRERVRHRSAVHAAVHNVIERSHLDQAVDDSAQRGCEGWLTNRPVRAVGQHDRICLEQIAVLAEEFGEVRRADLFLAFDEDRHGHRRSAFPRPQSCRMHRDASLVVRCATAEEPAIPLGRLERGGGPQFFGARRLDVVMGVQEHGRRVGRAVRHAVDRWVRLVDLEQADVIEPGALQPDRCPLSRFPHLRGIEAIGADRRNADEILEISADSRASAATR